MQRRDRGEYSTKGAPHRSHGKPPTLNYAQIAFDEDEQGAFRPVIRGDKPEPTQYSEVHPISLPAHKPIHDEPDGVIPQPKRAPRMVYENVDDPEHSDKSPECEVFMVVEDHKCVSMSAERLQVHRGDYVMAEKVESANGRALCSLAERPDSLRGWIPTKKLKLMYTRDSSVPTVMNPPLRIQSPENLQPLPSAPTVPPKSPDKPASAIKIRHKHHDAHLDQPWFVGKMSRSECEVAFNDFAKEGHFIIRESTYRIGDYTLSVQYEGRVRHFPIQLTEDERYYIGKHKFKNLCHVISYYQQHPLFHNEQKNPVSLGVPLCQIPSLC